MSGLLGLTLDPNALMHSWPMPAVHRMWCSTDMATSHVRGGHLLGDEDSGTWIGPEGLPWPGPPEPQIDADAADPEESPAQAQARDTVKEPSETA